MIAIYRSTSVFGVSRDRTSAYLMSFLDASVLSTRLQQDIRIKKIYKFHLLWYYLGNMLKGGNKMSYKVEHINQKGGLFKDAYDMLEKSMQKQLDDGYAKGWRVVDTHILLGVTGKGLEAYIIWEI